MRAPLLLRWILALIACVVSFAASAQWPPSPAVKLALNPVTNKVYVLNEFANTVSVLDAGNNVTRTIPVGPRPYYVAVNPATNRVYVNSSGDSSVQVIDGGTDTVIANLPIGSVGPIQVNPLTNTIYVVRLTGPGTDEVTFINGDTHSYYTIATESFQPIAVAINPVTNRMYIAHYATGDVRVISAAFDGNAHPATTSIGVWSKPFAIAANPMTNKVYVITEDARGPIAVIDGATNGATFIPYPAGKLVGPRALAINTVTNKIYAAYQGDLAEIDGATNALTIIPMVNTSGPVEVGINAFTNKIYVAKDNGTLTVIDGATRAMREVAIPAGITSVGVNPITNETYVFGESTTIVDGLAGETVMSNPIVTSIAPLPGDTAGSSVTFNLSATNSFGPARLPVTRAYVQLDSTEGAWTRATGSGPFTASFTGLANGTHTLYAFAADGQDAPLHTASQSAPLVGTIAKYVFSVGTQTPPPPPPATPTVSLASSANPSNLGQSITLTASVSGSAGTPTGSVEFRDGATAIAGCAAVALAAGTASCTTSALAAGAHTLTARYGGDSAYAAGSSAAITQTVYVPKVNATVALSSSLNPSTAGASVTFTASVAGSNGTATGTVSFTSGGATLCSAVTLAGGAASCTTSTLPTGTLTITAQYSGSAAYNAASATLTQTVNPVSAPAPAAQMVSPTNGATLAGPVQQFTWSAVSDATYALLVGSSAGANDLGANKYNDIRATSAKVTGLPTDGRRVYVRLITKVGGSTQFRDYQYLAGRK